MIIIKLARLITSPLKIPLTLAHTCYITINCQARDILNAVGCNSIELSAAFYHIKTHTSVDTTVPVAVRSLSPTIYSVLGAMSANRVHLQQQKPNVEESFALC